MLLETCNSIINSNVDDMEFWLQGLERVAKGMLYKFLFVLVIVVC